MASWLSAFMNGPEDGEYEASAAAEAGDNLVRLAASPISSLDTKIYIILNNIEISRSVTLTQAVFRRRSCCFQNYSTARFRNGPSSQVPLEEVQRAVALARRAPRPPTLPARSPPSAHPAAARQADAALRSKTRAAERKAIQASSLAYQKGSAASAAKARCAQRLRPRPAAGGGAAAAQPGSCDTRP